MMNDGKEMSEMSIRLTSELQQKEGEKKEIPSDSKVKKSVEKIINSVLVTSKHFWISYQPVYAIG